MVSASKRPGYIALGSVLVFNLLLLSLQTNQQGSPGFVREFLLDLLVPVEKVVERGLQGVTGVWNGYFALVGAQDENQKLKADNAQLRMQIQQQDEALREAARLRDFLGVKESGIGKTVVARVIGRDPSRYLQTITIDKGQSHGVRANHSVITPEGVVGRVLTAATSSAVVQLITDAQSEVAAMFRESRIQALFKGTGGRDLELDFIEDDDGVAVGAEVLTSGLDQVHPKGLPLAVISSVGAMGEHFRPMTAKPRVDLSRLEDVLVVIEVAEPSEPRQPPSIQQHPDGHAPAPSAQNPRRTEG